jgi:tetratricopeptide (TPR) repeat protein
MTTSPILADRGIVPRWRSLKRTIATGELAMPPRTIVTSREPSAELIKRLEAWRIAPDIVTAAEAVETAIVEQMIAEATRPAQILVRPDSGATNLLRDQAVRVLRELGHNDEVPVETDHESNTAAWLANWRRLTRFSPRDPFAWVELALSYVTVGKNKSALRAMNVALQLAPHDRYVLRSASRLFLHDDDPERAHDLLRNNDATRGDPWLMAGEIALSSLANRKPRFFKSGVELVDDSGMRPRQLSELASAIGTIHLNDGNRKARRLFTTSLVDPTGNSLAQAEWATPRLGKLVQLHTLELNQSDSIEARVFESYWNGDFKEVIRRCEMWRNEEPSSVRPAHFASSAAITIDDFQAALKFCDEGLRLKSDDVVLKNNRAYALVAEGHFADGLKLILSFLEGSGEAATAVGTATLGFYYMRIKNYDRGVVHYKDAISCLIRSKLTSLEVLAWAHFAFEAARAELPQAAQILADATDAFKRAKHVPEARVLLERATTWTLAIAHRREESTVVTG